MARALFSKAVRFGLVISAISISLLQTATAPAQPAPPDSVGALAVTVATDKPVYQAGEPVLITVQIENRLDQPRTLSFSSTHQADYGLDGLYLWSHGKAFATVMTQILLKPHEVHAFPAFRHLPGDFYLTPGPHRLQGMVVGYGAGGASITVTGSTPSGALLLSPTVEPNPAPFGGPIELAVTLTNLSDSTQSFVTDGCPVHFKIDGFYEPPTLRCPELARTWTVTPGQSLRFDSSQFGYLRLDPNLYNSVLGPGQHTIDLTVDGVGSATLDLSVVGSGGSISGHVRDENNAPLGFAEVEAISYPSSDSTGTSTGGIPYYYKTTTGDDGSYSFGGLPPAGYFVMAQRFDRPRVWYDNAPSQAEARLIPVSEGAAVAGIDFVLRPGPPPPPVYRSRISGTVWMEPPPGQRWPTRPLPGAFVVALRLPGGPVDSTIVPGDSTIVPGVGHSGPGAGPPMPPIKPPMPPMPPELTYSAIADSNGRYSLDVPPGSFKVVAGHPGYRYQWWYRSATWDSAKAVASVPVDSIGPVARAPSEAPSIDLFLVPYDASQNAQLAGIVNGLAGGPVGQPPMPVTGPPSPSTVRMPLAGARVLARPVIENPLLARPGPEMYTAFTGPDGRYGMSVPAWSPFIVQAWAEGYDSQFYDHAPSPAVARPADVAPSGVTENIDFDLFPGFVPPPAGVIQGRVYSYDPRLDGGPGGIRAPRDPLPGAIVHLHIIVGATGGSRELTAPADVAGNFLFSGLSTDASLTYYVSAQANSHLPAYAPGVFRWQESTAVRPSPFGPDSLSTTFVEVTLPAVLDPGPYLEVGLVRGSVPVIGPLPPGEVGGGGGGGSTGGGTAGGAAGSGTGGIASGFPCGPAPCDSTILPSLFPLPGAYLYLVPATATEGAVAPVAAGVASENGTLVIDRLAAGQYKAYADVPGFQTGWFHGTGYPDAAVITVGEGIDPVVIDIVLEPLTGSSTGGQGGDRLTPSVVSNVHNTPNPARPQTTIIYRLLASTEVSLQIFDVRGRLIRTLFDNSPQQPGEQRVPWDGQAEWGAPAPGGVYFYRVLTPRQSSIGKIVLVR